MENVLTIGEDARGRRIYRHGGQRIARKRWHELAPKADIHIDGVILSSKPNPPGTCWFCGSGEHMAAERRYTHGGQNYVGTYCPKERVKYGAH